MTQASEDEKLLILARIIKETSRLRQMAGRSKLDMLAFLLAQAEDEASEQKCRLEASATDD
jgi:hypothetical protein